MGDDCGLSERDACQLEPRGDPLWDVAIGVVHGDEMPHVLWEALLGYGVSDLLPQACHVAQVVDGHQAACERERAAHHLQPAGAEGLGSSSAVSLGVHTEVVLSLLITHPAGQKTTA